MPADSSRVAKSVFATHNDAVFSERQIRISVKPFTPEQAPSVNFPMGGTNLLPTCRATPLPVGRCTYWPIGALADLHPHHAMQCGGTLPPECCGRVKAHILRLGPFDRFVPTM